MKRPKAARPGRPHAFDRKLLEQSRRTVKLLLDRGANPNAKKVDSATPLSIATNKRYKGDSGVAEEGESEMNFELRIADCGFAIGCD
jgi:hypothetical protein